MVMFTARQNLANLNEVKMNLIIKFANLAGKSYSYSLQNLVPYYILGEILEEIVQISPIFKSLSPRKHILTIFIIIIRMHKIKVLIN